MKNKKMFYLAVAAITLVQIVVLLALCLNAVLPIVMMLTRHGFTWLFTYFCLPLWIALYVWLDNVMEDM